MSVDSPARQASPNGGGDDAGDQGLYLYGVVRAAGWRERRRRTDGVLRVRFRELEALVRPVPFQQAEAEGRAVQDHQRTVDGFMRRGNVLPAPFGLVFRGRRAIIRFLEDQYIVLDEGLAFLDGHWELRLHILGDAEHPDDRELATTLYTELRRFVRAALPLPTGPGAVLSAAFLVERATWIPFVERTEDLNRAHADLVFDLTGPWPPYDFVTVRP